MHETTDQRLRQQTRSYMSNRRQEAGPFSGSNNITYSAPIDHYCYANTRQQSFNDKIRMISDTTSYIILCKMFPYCFVFVFFSLLCYIFVLFSRSRYNAPHRHTHTHTFNCIGIRRESTHSNVPMNSNSRKMSEAPLFGRIVREKNAGATRLTEVANNILSIERDYTHMNLIGVNRLSSHTI